MKKNDLLALLVTCAFFVCAGLAVSLHSIPSEESVISPRPETYQLMAEEAREGKITTDWLIAHLRRASIANEATERKLIEMVHEVRTFGFALLAGAMVQIYVILRVGSQRRQAVDKVQETS